MAIGGLLSSRPSICYLQESSQQINSLGLEHVPTCPTKVNFGNQILEDSSLVFHKMKNPRLAILKF